MNLPLLARLLVLGAGLDAGAPVDAGPRGGILLPPGRTTTVVVQDAVGQPLERQGDFLAAAPSYRRAIASDRDQRWVEAVGLYQQALIEVGAAAQLAPPQQLDQVAFKIELERRRSRALAEDAAAESNAARRPPGSATPPVRLLPMERARLLRQKLMAVRATVGSTPAALRASALAALTRVLQEAERDGGARDPAAPSAAEARMLMCATLAAAGDREAARAELARVRPDDRIDPARALPLAACQAALGWRDDALGSLAVAVARLGPSSRFLPGPSREIQSANDWDTLRTDPRFARLFR